VVPSGAVLIPLHVTVEVSSGYDGCLAEPPGMFHETAVDLADVIVRTLGPDWTRPDRQQVEIHSCTMNPNGNDPFAEGLAHRLNCELFTAKDSYSLVQIGTEPLAGEAVGVENIH
jgi:hypothetical protein